MKPKPDDVHGLVLLSGVRLDQASRGGSSFRTSTLPSLYGNSQAASLSDFQSGKSEVTKASKHHCTTGQRVKLMQNSIEPSKPKVKADKSRFPPIHGSQPIVHLDQQEATLPVEDFTESRSHHKDVIGSALSIKTVPLLARRALKNALPEHLSPKPPVNPRPPLVPRSPLTSRPQVTPLIKIYRSITQGNMSKDLEIMNAAHLRSVRMVRPAKTSPHRLVFRRITPAVVME
ncbi:hypothetical protein DPEC_G00035580 [Dallia pectoralis]|uniref:Uncharacterized protein n=1 Tax=Dallia pectoralis TaxID=75939 RepID=A0ACC2HE82_DALPE|nr:hypothetical protein DPEC_G00035580 [Dallia pectoralis]